MPALSRKDVRNGFTLLEVVIVLFIVALVLAAVHSIAQGTLTLAEDVRRTQRSESRQQAFTGFCEHLFATLPAASTLKLRTTQDGGQYLSKLELKNMPSPFDGFPECVVTLFTEPLPGGGMRLLLSCQKKADAAPYVSVMLFDELAQCEWRAFDPNSRQWATQWKEGLEENSRHVHPPLVEVTMAGTDGQVVRCVFWVAPNTSVGLVTVPPLTGAPPPVQAIPP